VEAPCDFIAQDLVCKYSAEVIIFEALTGASSPAEVGRFSVKNLDESPVGCYTHGTMETKIKNPILWSAEKVTRWSFLCRAKLCMQVRFQHCDGSLSAPVKHFEENMCEVTSLSSHGRHILTQVCCSLSYCTALFVHYGTAVKGSSWSTR
jgi:hypothetical protein